MAPIVITGTLLLLALLIVAGPPLEALMDKLRPPAHRPAQHRLTGRPR